MKQSRLMSMVEASTNVAIGYSISVASNLVVLPAFGYPVTLRDGMAIGLVFTVIALLRTYTLRRVFEWRR